MTSLLPDLDPAETRRADAPPAAGPLTIDVTTLVESTSPPHGISRLIAQSARGFLDAGVAVAFIRYSARHRGFVHLEGAGRTMLDVMERGGAAGRCRVVQPPAAPPAPAGAKVGALGRLYYGLPSEARLRLRQAAVDGVGAVGNLLSGSGALLRAARSGDAKLTRFGGRDGGPYRPRPGERVLLANALWGQPGVAEALDGLGAAGADVTSVVCDLLPMRRPEFFTASFSARFAEWALATLRGSRRILAISEATAADVAAEALRNGVACPPVTVLRLGDDAIPATPPGDAAVDPAVRALADRPFVLSLGTIEARKNHQLLYRVWRRLAVQAAETGQAQAPPRLLIVGQPGWLTDQTHHALTSDPVLHGHVALVHGADDATVSWLLSRCLFTLYPSFVEGWGLPVAESLAHGRPVLAGTAPSLREAGQGLALHLDPDDVPGWTRAVAELAGDPERRAALEREIARSYRLTTWRDTADRLGRLMAGPA